MTASTLPNNRQLPRHHRSLRKESKCRGLQLLVSPKEVDVSWESATSSTDMELSTPRSPFLENHLAIELDLFFDDTAELPGDLGTSMLDAFVRRQRQG